ncbi:MAG TPA: SDR family oxidoreductase [Gemmatimonadaceae bacterium]|nr:SDR family oxidoreductase [Gemmatimonadaceae bacterium]
MPEPRQVVCVTGASAGLGRAIVQRFAREGAHVALLARGRERLEAAAREVEAGGGRALVLPTDVADADAVEAAAETTERELGPIDVWVNNAMVSVYSPIKEMTAAEFRRVTEVTYLGYVHGTLAALHRMLPRDRGVIVQVGSALAYRSIPLQSAYCAAKHAIVGFTASLRSELIHDGSNVRVTMVHMPALNTPQFDWTRNRLPNRPQPVPPIFQPEVGAEAVFHAAQHDVGRELMVAWPTVKAVLGNKVIPGYLDHYLADVAYEGEQTNEPEDPDRPDNLFQPVPGDWAAHGRFDRRSKWESWELALRLNRQLLAVAGAGLAGLAIGALTGRRHPDVERPIRADGAIGAGEGAYADALEYARADGAATEPPARSGAEPPDSALAALHVPTAEPPR